MTLEQRRFVCEEMERCRIQVNKRAMQLQRCTALLAVHVIACDLVGASRSHTGQGIEMRWEDYLFVNTMMDANLKFTFTIVTVLGHKSGVSGVLPPMYYLFAPPFNNNFI